MKEVVDMPIISLFYGIKITMYYDEHRPPHFHADYNGQKAEVSIKDAKVIKGALPNKQLKLILAWAVMHENELLENWEAIENGSMNLKKIAPLS